MVRMGKDVSAKLDIVPARFFVHASRAWQVGLQMLPVPHCSPCTRPCESLCSAPECFTRMRRRSTCSIRARARPKKPTSRAKPLCDEMPHWLTLERQRVPDGSGIARAIDDSLNRWGPLTAYLRDGRAPIDHNHVYAVVGINGSKTRFVPSRLDETMGCSPAHSGRASARLR